MKKVYHLKTCNTCERIIKALELPDDFTFQEIKSEDITVRQIEQLKELAGSYEALFSRRAKLYKEMGLKDITLSEADYKHYILDHYTFLKRPVIVMNDHIFIGNSAKTIEAAKAYTHTNEQ
ncbi:arsenate reductase family protein [Psychroserpens sp.]|uniref:arsenate reductase family protein n=1 Tax=Psychroserpens sp. TaxID=2020870 RepID=UPI003859E111